MHSLEAIPFEIVAMQSLSNCKNRLDNSHQWGRLCIRGVPISYQTNHFTMKVSTLLLCIALLLGTGCDSNDPEDRVPVTGSFTMTVSGDVNKTVNGSIATFGTGIGPAAGQSAFGLNLGSATDILSMSRLSGRPGTGSVTIQDVFDTNEEDWDPDHLGATYLDESAGLYASTSGSVTITRSEENVIEGSFAITLVNLDTNTTSTITLTGEFVAIGLEFPTGG